MLRKLCRYLFTFKAPQCSGFHTGFFVRERKKSIMQSTMLLGIRVACSPRKYFNLGPLSCFWGFRRLAAEMLLHVEINLV